MGTFGGHALPGSFFIIFAIYWSVQIYRRMLRKHVLIQPNGSKTQNKHGDNQMAARCCEVEEYRSSVTFPVDCFSNPRLSNFPWEGFFKVIFTTVGLTLEIITGFKDGRFTHLGNLQHATMFSAFGLAGVVDILLHYGVPLPHNADYAMSVLAFAVENILFMFHLHGRNSLDMMLHTMLVYVIHGCIFIILLEMRLPSSPNVALFRSYLVLLQGTWFWQIGFILYNPLPGRSPWNGEDHSLMMIGAVIFAWHVILDFALILAIGLLVRFLYFRCPNACSCCFNSDGGAKRDGHVTRDYEVVQLLSRGDEEASDSEVVHFGGATTA